MTHPGLGFASADDFARAHYLLTAASYNDKAMLAMVGLPAEALPRNAGAVLALGKSAPGTPLDTLIRLFLVGAPVDVRIARDALKPMPLQTWVEAGLISCDADQARSLVRLVPFRGLWLAHDLPQRKQREDYVMGVGTTTVRLMDIAVRRPIRSMLDLGSGCGTQGLFAAKHAARVLATDYNTRAVQFSKFNVAINGLKNVETTGGHLFEPVKGEKFDLVLSNPPFVISPESRYIYRDGGMPGDGFCERLVREVPAVLQEGGYCQLLCNWAHHRGQDWKSRLAQWFDGSRCDAWVMRCETEDVIAYAYTWIRQTESEEPVRLSEVHKQWMQYYTEQNIEAVSTGIICMRKASDRPNWVRIDDMPPNVLGPCGDDIELAFGLGEFLQTVRDDEQLMLVKPRVSPVVQLSQKMTPTEGAWGIDNMELRREQGLGAVVAVDAYVAGLVGRCDGTRTLGDLIDELAGALNRRRDEISAPMLAIVRQLIERAILLPEGMFG